MLEAVTHVDTVITTAGLIIIAILSASSAVSIALINRTRQHAKATREQTENNHIGAEGKISNLRENIDSNQDSINGKLNKIIATQEKQETKLDRLYDITDSHRNAIIELSELRKRKRNI